MVAFTCNCSGFAETIDRLEATEGLLAATRQVAVEKCKTTNWI